MPDCIELNPDNPADASVIWLHGLGADGNDFVPVVDQLGLPADHGVRFVFPNAPRRPITINGGMVMPGWYDIVSPDLQAREDAEGIRASQAATEALIAREVDNGIQSERIVLAGFSQGGAIALHTGLRHTRQLAGIMALSCYLPLRDTLAAQASPANRNTPLFMAHGDMDPVVPFAGGTATRDLLADAGYQPDWHSYPMGHQVCAQEIHDIGLWLRSQLMD